MLLLTLRGTPTVYYGDEIAMKQVAMAPDQIRDPLGKNVSGRGLGWVRHDDSSRAPALWQGCSCEHSPGQMWASVRFTPIRRVATNTAPVRFALSSLA